jgi:hypothetical protein
MQLSNPWLSLIGERLETPDGQVLDYWRIERADSAIIVPIWRQQLILAPPTYRPGIGEVMLDFPGGRIPASSSPTEAAHAILQRELGLKAEAVQTLTSLNSTGWPINSSLSDQRLFGFWAQLSDELNVTESNNFPAFPFTQAGVAQLLAVLPCLQCRSVLMTLTQQHNLER